MGLLFYSGKGIQDIRKVSGDGSAGSVDTYMIYYTDNSATTYTVRNGSNGSAPHIGDNGNWWVGTIDLGVSASHPDLTGYSTKGQADLLYKAIGYEPDLSAYATKTECDNYYMPKNTSLFSGNYADLTGKPTIPTVYGWALAANKPSYSYSEVGAAPTIHSHYEYESFLGLPANDGYILSSTTVGGRSWIPIPSSQVQTDWNASSGMGSVLNKPTKLSQFANDLGNYGSFVTGTPWTSQGYITSSALSSYLPLTGGTLSGVLTMNANIDMAYRNLIQVGGLTSTGTITANQFNCSYNRAALRLNSGSSGYGAFIDYDTNGSECMGFGVDYIGSSFKFKTGIAASSVGGGSFMNITPDFEIRSGAAYVNGSTVIHSGNIGSQSVNYANGAGSAGFANYSTYLNSSNYIQQKGYQGSWNADFQATPAGSLSYGGDLGAGGTNGPGGSWWFEQNFRHTNSSNYWGVQVAWGWGDNANRLATRNVTVGNFGGWVYYLNSSNFSQWAAPVSHTHDYATHRGEGTNYVDYSRYVYNNGAYSGSGWVEPSDLGVRYAAYAANAGSVGGYSATSLITGVTLQAWRMTSPGSYAAPDYAYWITCERSNSSGDYQITLPYSKSPGKTICIKGCNTIGNIIVFGNGYSIQHHSDTVGSVTIPKDWYTCTFVWDGAYWQMSMGSNW